MKINENGVAYGDPGHLPVFYGFCPNEKAWKKELGRLGVEKRSYPDSIASCTWFTTKRGQMICLVTMHADEDRAYGVGLVGTIAHEAMHVWQKTRDYIGEEHPSYELEAYTYQAIFTELVKGYEATRAPKLFTKRIPN